LKKAVENMHFTFSFLGTSLLFVNQIFVFIIFKELTVIGANLLPEQLNRLSAGVRKLTGEDIRGPSGTWRTLTPVQVNQISRPKKSLVPSSVLPAVVEAAYDKNSRPKKTSGNIAVPIPKATTKFEEPLSSADLRPRKPPSSQRDFTVAPLPVPVAAPQAPAPQAALPQVPAPKVTDAGYCEDVIPGWADSLGFTCVDYASSEFCTLSKGYGPGWNNLWGDFSVYAVQGRDATQACCKCGAVRGSDLQMEMLFVPPEVQEFVASDLSSFFVPSEELTCEDTTKGWVDSLGYSCDKYDEYKFCTSTKGYGAGWDEDWGAFIVYAVSGLSATDVCCTCGGGVMRAIPKVQRPEFVAPPVHVTSPPTPIPHFIASCRDKYDGWYDSYGYHCSDYVSKELCTLDKGYGSGWDPTWGSFDSYAVNGLSATEICCGCGGGVASGPCKDVDEWVDSYGYTCLHYKKQEFCTPDKGYGPGWGFDWGSFSLYTNDGMDATHACCQCGKAHSPPLPLPPVPVPAPIPAPSAQVPVPTPAPCQDWTPGWLDSFGYSCQAYAEKQFCTPKRGYGVGWDVDWGIFEEYAMNGLDATDVCCACGGGTSGVAVPKNHMLKVNAASTLPCKDTPNWKDAFGYTCQQYADRAFCTPDKEYGPGWGSDWGTFALYTNLGVDATEACCKCGKQGSTQAITSEYPIQPSEAELALEELRKEMAQQQQVIQQQNALIAKTMAHGLDDNVVQETSTYSENPRNSVVEVKNPSPARDGAFNVEMAKLQNALEVINQVEEKQAKQEVAPQPTTPEPRATPEPKATPYAYGSSSIHTDVLVSEEKQSIATGSGPVEETRTIVEAQGRPSAQEMNSEKVTQGREPAQEVYSEKDTESEKVDAPTANQSMTETEAPEENTPSKPEETPVSDSDTPENNINADKLAHLTKKQALKLGITLPDVDEDNEEDDEEEQTTEVIEPVAPAASEKITADISSKLVDLKTYVGSRSSQALNSRDIANTLGLKMQSEGKAVSAEEKTPISEAKSSIVQKVTNTTSPSSIALAEAKNETKADLSLEKVVIQPILPTTKPVRPTIKPFVANPIANPVVKPPITNPVVKPAVPEKENPQNKTAEQSAPTLPSWGALRAIATRPVGQTETPPVVNQLAQGGNSTERGLNSTLIGIQKNITSAGTVDETRDSSQQMDNKNITQAGNTEILSNVTSLEDEANSKFKPQTLDDESESRVASFQKKLQRVKDAYVAAGHVEVASWTEKDFNIPEVSTFEEKMKTLQSALTDLHQMTKDELDGVTMVALKEAKKAADSEEAKAAVLAATKTLSQPSSNTLLQTASANDQLQSTTDSQPSSAGSTDQLPPTTDSQLSAGAPIQVPSKAVTANSPQPIAVESHATISTQVVSRGAPIQVPSEAVAANSPQPISVESHATSSAQVVSRAAPIQVPSKAVTANSVPSQGTSSTPVDSPEAQSPVQAQTTGPVPVASPGTSTLLESSETSIPVPSQANSPAPVASLAPIPDQSEAVSPAPAEAPVQVPSEALAQTNSTPVASPEPPLQDPAEAWAANSTQPFSPASATSQEGFKEEVLSKAVTENSTQPVPLPQPANSTLLASLDLESPTEVPSMAVTTNSTQPAPVPAQANSAFVASLEKAKKALAKGFSANSTLSTEVPSEAASSNQVLPALGKQDSTNTGGSNSTVSSQAASSSQVASRVTADIPSSSTVQVASRARNPVQVASAVPVEGKIPSAGAVQVASRSSSPVQVASKALPSKPAAPADVSTTEASVEDILPVLAVTEVSLPASPVPPPTQATSPAPAVAAAVPVAASSLPSSVSPAPAVAAAVPVAASPAPAVAAAVAISLPVAPAAPMPLATAVAAPVAQVSAPVLQSAVPVPAGGSVQIALPAPPVPPTTPVANAASVAPGVAVVASSSNVQVAAVAAPGPLPSAVAVAVPTVPLPSSVAVATSSALPSAVAVAIPAQASAVPVIPMPFMAVPTQPGGEIHASPGATLVTGEVNIALPAPPMPPSGNGPAAIQLPAPPSPPGAAGSTPNRPPPPAPNSFYSTQQSMQQVLQLNAMRGTSEHPAVEQNPYIFGIVTLSGLFGLLLKWKFFSRRLSFNTEYEIIRTS